MRKQSGIQAGEQLAQVDVENHGEANQRVECRIPMAAIDPRIIGHVQPGSQGNGLLVKGEREASLAKSKPEESAGF
ncbi:hypothetical protein JF66_07590 [Cryobacterium sp. MLB-32]|nr:hypothetical protein JF66_07590 [Cryobacterium sp. MLB-32]